MPEKKVIVNPKGFPVQPENIDTSKHFYSAFGNTETEISAKWIVSYLRQRGEGWVPFTYEEINTFYAKKFQDSFSFNQLTNPSIEAGGSWVVLKEDKKYYVTDDFVARCFQSSPKY